MPHLIYGSRESCGNVGIAERFPRTVISAAWLASLRPGSLLLFFRGSTEAIGFGTGFQDVTAIGDSIQQRFAQSRIRNDLRPLRKWQIRSEHHSGFLGALGLAIVQLL